MLYRTKKYGNFTDNPRNNTTKRNSVGLRSTGNREGGSETDRTTTPREESENDNNDNTDTNEIIQVINTKGGRYGQTCSPYEPSKGFRRML